VVSLVNVHSQCLGPPTYQLVSSAKTAGQLRMSSISFRYAPWTLRPARCRACCPGADAAPDDDVELAQALNECRGHVVLSGYPFDLYQELYTGWRVVTFDMPNNAAGGWTKGRKAETVCVK
jgi:hypothetical protein